MSIVIRTLRVPIYPDKHAKKELEMTFYQYSKATQTAFDDADANNTSNRLKVHDEYVLYELAQKATGFLRGAPVIIPNVAS